MSALTQRLLDHINALKKPQTANTIINAICPPGTPRKAARDAIQTLTRKGLINSTQPASSMRVYGPLAPVNLPLISALGYPSNAPASPTTGRQYDVRHSAASNRASLPRSSTSAALAIAAGE